MTSLHDDYRRSLRALDSYVDAVFSFIRDCSSVSHAFRDTLTAAHELVVQNWLTAKDDDGILGATAGKSAFSWVWGGYANDGGESDVSDFRNSEDSDEEGVTR